MLKQSAGEAGGLYHLPGVQLREREKGRRRKPTAGGTNFKIKGKSMCFLVSALGTIFLKTAGDERRAEERKPLPGSITPFVREQN